jgi:hypothetical protein
VRLPRAHTLTAVAILATCAVTMVSGLAIVSFAGARARVLAHEDEPQTLRRWTSAPWLAGAALEALLTTATDPSDVAATRRRADELVALLALRPLSSMHWLSLAGAWLVAQKPYDRMLAALAMSALTGRNEDHVMLPRAIFGLLQWEALPSDARRQVIADLSGTMSAGVVPDHNALAAKTLLAAKTPETRREIADLLAVEDIPPHELARIGL